MEDKPRELYLVVYNRPLFKAHWALFVPSIDNASVGKKIHAVGDALAGFSVAFDRNYNLGTTTRSHSLVHLGHIGAAYIDEASVLGDGPCISDNVAQDLCRFRSRSRAESPIFIVLGHQGWFCAVLEVTNEYKLINIWCIETN